MTKKLLSQNKSHKSQGTTEFSTANNSNDNSTNSHIAENKINHNLKQDIFSTPLKQNKKNQFFPYSPKKKKRFLENDDINIIGKNLYSIYKSM